MGTEAEKKELPWITGELAGIGGRIKASPSDFVVEEEPLYEPGGQGEHIYVRVTREGYNTRDIASLLARGLGIKIGDVGYAGLKDKVARVTQTFSLYVPGQDDARVQKKIAAVFGDAGGIESGEIKRHQNKLKRGHLAGNRFRIVLSGTEGSAQKLARAREIGALLTQRGFPNYYGPQRFGASGENDKRGRNILIGRERPRDRSLESLYLSAYQSHLFNLWLGERIEAGHGLKILSGDLASKVETGGVFLVEEAEREMAERRLEAGEIVYTGPMYGHKMRASEGEPGELEKKILKRENVTLALFRRARLTGSRRPAFVRPRDLMIDCGERGLEFIFALPPGAYGTSLLREIIKE